MMNDELKPCPFCGCNDTSVWRDENWQYYAGCNNCLATSASFPKKEDAIKAWNRRVDDDTIHLNCKKNK